MRKRIANRLLNLARRLNPNIVVDVTPWPPVRPACVKVSKQMFIDERDDPDNRALREYVNRQMRSAANMQVRGV